MAAIVYDTLLLFTVLFFASVIVVVPLGITPDHDWYWLYCLYIYGVALVFFGWFWTHGGQTLGMKTWQLRVQDPAGKPLTWRRAALRFVAACVSWLLFGGGFLWCLVDRHGRALHDIVSQTELVRINPEPGPDHG